MAIGAVMTLPIFGVDFNELQKYKKNLSGRKTVVACVTH